MSRIQDEQWRAEALAALEEMLAQLCAHPSVDSSLQEVLHYAVFPAGKRIRSLLAIALGLDLGASLHQLAPVAAAIELMHCASLVHDDLPALDNDDMRRGKPSSHRAFGQGPALLAGDLAVPLAIQAVLYSDLEASTRVLLAQECSGAFVQLCNGQQRDLQSGEARGDILALYAQKTGALFGAACAAGAVVAARGERVREEARRLGTELGVLFQLHDDAIDESPAKGRATGSDARNHKETAVRTVGQGALHAARNRTTEALARVEMAMIEGETSMELRRTRTLLHGLLSDSSATI